MANYFDQFDAPSTKASQPQPVSSGGNFFDQFDAPPAKTSPEPSAPSFDTGRFDLGSVKNDPALRAGMERQAAAQQSKDIQPNSFLDTVATMAGGAIEGIPVLGPILRGGAERAAALTVAPFSDETYGQLLEKIQRDKARMKEERPVLDTVSQLGGGIGFTMGLGSTATGAKVLGDVGGTLGRRMAAGAVSGGAIGGADALVRSGGDLESTARGAALGGGLGLVAPAVLAGISKGVNAATEKVSAARRVSNSLSRDAAAGNAGLTRAELAAAQADGVPAVIADMGGESTRALARSAVNTSPEARDALTRVTSDRFAGQSTRIADEVAGLSPLGANAAASLDKLKAAAQAANRPAYAKAYMQGANGVWDDELAALTRAPDVSDAIRKATRTGGNKAVADGFKPVTNPFVVDAAGEVSLRTAADGSTAVPSLQFWDHVKRNLDDTIEAAKRAGNRNAAADATELKSQLVAKLDAAVPDYAAARSGAAAFFGAEDALEAGQKFVSASGKNAEYAKAISKMSDPEKKLFAEGFTSSLSARLRESSDRQNTISKLMNSPASRDRVRMALGLQGSARLEARLRLESTMDALRTAVSGNSTTARQLAEMGMAGGAGGILGGWSGDWDAGSISLGAIMGAAARRGMVKVDARVAQKVGEMLSSTDPKVIDKALAMAARHPPVMRLIEGAERLLVTNSGMAGGQAGASFGR